jgi:signal transduction histidine kinase
MFRRSRWVAVVGAIAVVALVELLADSVLDPWLPFPVDTLVVVAAMATVAVIGAWLAFSRLDLLADSLRRRNEELEASDAAVHELHRVSMSLSTVADIDTLLQALVDSARELLHADVAALVLVRADGAPALTATSGPSEAFDPTGDLEGEDFLRFVRPEHMTVHLAAPIRMAGRSVGTLVVGSRTERAYGVADVESVASLASQAAIAIENDRLERQLREMAVRGERERIAREMHDGLAQVLGYVNTKSQAVEEHLAAGRLDAARAQLSELAAAARSVYVDVREAILGLSSPVAPEGDLVAACESYAHRFSDASKLVVSVVASDEARSIRLTPESQAETFRVLQEALTNVRKHAAAQRVRVTFDVSDDQLRLCVDDDGRGMSEDHGVTEAFEDGAWPRYGLRSMRARASAMGGVLELIQLPRGTRVELRIPLTPAVMVA